MIAETQFSESVASKLGHYVYRLIDPRNGATFYVGRGQGNRIFSHAAGKQVPNNNEDGENLKLRIIWDITNAGLAVAHVIHRHGLSEDSAREVEAALIDAYPGLTNLIGGYDGRRGVMHATEIITLYEAPSAEPHHKLIIINVNKSSEDQNLLDAVRYAWKIDPRKARLADYVLAVRRGLIIGAFKPLEWLPATPDNFPGIIRDGYGPMEGRFGFRGELAPTDIRELYVQKRAPIQKRGASNPIRYWNM